MTAKKYVRGDKLPAPLQAEVLRRFVHRWTEENARKTYGGKCPACVQQQQCGGAMQIDRSGQIIPWHDYHAPLATDREWLAQHAFVVTHKGQLDARQQYAEPACMVGEVVTC